jgi:hypothetical protein
MPQPKNVMEIFQLLEKSNCRECGLPTCLAFAGAVLAGRKRLDECPRLSPGVIEQYGGDGGKPRTYGQNQLDYLEGLRRQAAGMDLAAAAGRAGGRFSEGRLTLKVLGKSFSVDTGGNLHADIHVNPWVAVPFLNYVLHGRGLAPTGNWVSLRDLRGGRERHPLFHRRCEEPMKRVADAHPDLFDHMVHTFGGRQVEKQFESDISVVLHPLPKIPVMVCYWMPAGRLASSLHVFFDDTADRNLDTESVFNLGTGMAMMFEKLALTHGFPDASSSGSPG